jgi:tRNA A37 threonylcarbamoyladenosine synthetase subunit TsaC/SUA5/YrdC
MQALPPLLVHVQNISDQTSYVHHSPLNHHKWRQIDQTSIGELTFLFDKNSHVEEPHMGPPQWSNQIEI